MASVPKQHAASGRLSHLRCESGKPLKEWNLVVPEQVLNRFWAEMNSDQEEICK